MPPIPGPASAPIEIANVPLRNRIGLAPLNTGLLQESAFYRQFARDFYGQYAQNQVALIYLGGIAVCADGRANSSSLALVGANQAQLLRDIIAVCHSAGARVAIQLEHAGRQANPAEIQAEIFAASAIACPVVGATPREASAGDIARVVRAFSQAARLAQDAGADFVEIHAAHGYLLSGFLSASANLRTDSYGGCAANRFRLLNEVICAVRAAVSLPIGIRVNVEEGVPNGLTVEQLLAGIRCLSTMPDYVSVTAGTYTRGVDLIMPPKELGAAIWATQAARLRQELNIPVFLAGNINTLEAAEHALQTGSADVLLMGRALLTDPFLLTKASARRRDQIVECIYCSKCKYHSRGAQNIYCPLNTLLRSRERGTH